MIIAEPISRIRGVLKLVHDDAFVTDRQIYSLIMKYAKTLIKREAMLKNIFGMVNLFEEIPCFDMKEVPVIESCCTGLKTKCTFMRSVNKLPKMMDINGEPMIKYIDNLDYNVNVYKTSPERFGNIAKSKNFKYNKNAYYWIVNGYLYLANVEWESVRIAAIFEEDVEQYLCSPGNITGKYDCTPMQDKDFNIPEDLFSEIENLVRQEMLTTVQLPPSGPDDNQNIMR